MGANIKVENGTTAIIDGVQKLTGAPICALDLRAGVAMIIAGFSKRYFILVLVRLTILNVDMKALLVNYAL